MQNNGPIYVIRMTNARFQMSPIKCLLQFNGSQQTLAQLLFLNNGKFKDKHDTWIRIFQLCGNLEEFNHH